jgi:predicted flap endonuclease-1-like 5' DNA nuclease
MRGLHKWILVLVSSFGLLFGTMFVCTAAGAQANTKKSSSSGTKSAANADKKPVDLNTASEKDLDELPGVGPATAKKIIAGRPYSSVADLSKAGVPERTIKKITPMVTVGSAPTSAETKSAASKKTSSSEVATPAPSKSTSKASAAPRTEQAAGGGDGKVWVNTKSGVYHKEGDRWYGKTKEGKYMTEDEAIKAAYRADKDKQGHKKE